MSASAVWTPEGDGFVMQIGEAVYRIGSFPQGSRLRGRYGCWQGSRLLGHRPKLTGAKALCERAAAIAARASSLKTRI